MVVPASCRRSGRCHECIVEILRGGDALSPTDDQERFLRPGYRLACRATVVGQPAEGNLEFIVLRRRLKILMPPSGPPLEVDPALTIRDGRVRWFDEDVDAARERLLGIALDVERRRSSSSCSTCRPARRSPSGPSRTPSGSGEAMSSAGSRTRRSARASCGGRCGGPSTTSCRASTPRARSSATTSSRSWSSATRPCATCSSALTSPRSGIRRSGASPRRPGERAPPRI